ncbi:MAG: LuxR C-terminal-related transcriptional regulator [Actinomycetota bacterium]|nr:LuxR C-terminal-related transcriptional regulator [Actinomycetota bacterium]
MSEVVAAVPATVSINLLAPRLPGGLVDRPRLESRLGPGTGASWTLVVGPPGSGKTTLVRSWLERWPGPWAWVGIDTGGPTHGHVIELIVRGLHGSHAAGTLDALDALDMDETTDDDLLGALLAGLTAEPGPGNHPRAGPDATGDRPAVVVIDDAHCLEGVEWRQLHRLLRHLPPTLHLVVISRSDPPIPMGRERASGRMTEVRAEHLAFDLAETRRLVAASGEVRTPEVADDLHARTEGWVAGLRLALLAARDGADLRGLVTSFGGTHASVTELLVEEVLERLPEERRAFLLDASVLGVLDAQLCEVVTGRTDAGELLDRLARDGVFLTRAGDHADPGPDAPPDRYRFHPLFAEFLQHVQRHGDPSRVRERRLRLADWLLAHDRPVDAIEHLLVAEEHTRAHDVLLEHFDAIYVGPHRRDLGRWLAAVPDDVVAATTERAVSHTACLALVAHEDLRRWFAHCDERVAPDDDANHSRLAAMTALNRGYNGRAEEMRTRWHESRARRPAQRHEPLDEVLALWDARLEAHLGDPERAIDIARALLSQERGVIHDAVALSVLAGAFAAAGRDEDALAIAERSVQRWRDAGAPDLPGMADALTVCATARRRDGELDEAEDLVDLALAIVPRPRYPHLLSCIPLVERARIHRARGLTTWRSDLVTTAEELRLSGAPDELIAWVDRARREGGPEPTARPTPPGPPPILPAGLEPLVEELTSRERTILGFLASHLTFPQIGGELCISRHTVKSHVARIYRKLGVSSRSEAIDAARARGLLPA